MMTAHKNLEEALAACNSEEAEVVYQAIYQYFENQRDFVDSEDKPDPAEVRRRDVAERVMLRLDAVMAALAEV
jgi:hypothetical protein